MADETDFHEFVNARWKPLVKAAWLLTGDWQLAEDLLQTALAKCFFRWGRISGEKEAYVRRALVMTYLTWRRRRWHGEQPTDVVEDRLDSSDRYGEIDLRRTVAIALAGLPRRQRAVVVLRYYCDLTEADIATALGCSIGTVKSHAARALSKLRESDLADTIHKGTR